MNRQHARLVNPGTDSQFPAKCAGNLVSVPGLPSAYRMVRVAELEAVPFGFTTCTVQVRAAAPTFTATLIWLAASFRQSAPETWCQSRVCQAPIAWSELRSWKPCRSGSRLATPQ